MPDEDEEVVKVDSLLNKPPVKTFEGALQTKQGRNRPVEFERNVFYFIIGRNLRHGLLRREKGQKMIM